MARKKKETGRIYAMREEAKENARKNRSKAKDISKNAMCLGKDIPGELDIEKYEVQMDGLSVANWKDVKLNPLPTDTRYRYDNPVSLKIAFEDYVKWTVRNPFKKDVLITSGAAAGDIIETSTPRPLTPQMFLAFIKMPKSAWERKKKDPDFTEVCEIIEDIIKANILDAGLVGHVNPILASKINKLDDSNVTITHQRAINVNIVSEQGDVPNRLELPG